MSSLYCITIEKLPVPVAPIGQGHTDRKLTLSSTPDEHRTESEALNRARKLITEGYAISMTDPAGRRWTNDEIFAKINASEN